ncbi:MAG: NAD-dependent DNA ligase LigA [Candidatus Omnitrophica bacterium]|nr:NAD-dependent DNA ligase LigA [Candidatus Omnitrophota bacterium]
MPTDIKKKIGALREKIREHDYRYYVLSQPTVSDKEYDELMRQLKDIEDKHPEFKTDDSPTVRVGSGILEGFKTARHKQKMLSLDNTYSFQELKEWDERVRKGLKPGQGLEYVAEMKIDGVSANITYEKGRLSIGATRGDGETGEDVTANIKTIRAIPLALRDGDIPDFIEIRGEIYMDRRDFDILNKDRDGLEETLFANPRNAASGSLKLLDTALVAKRRLNFFAHSLGQYRGKVIPTQWEFLEKLKIWGMRINDNRRLCVSLEEVIEYCRFWQGQREKLSYDIDGIVVKINSMAQQEGLGYTMKSPRWAVAYKFPARQATTDVVKIDFQVGRTGVITPVAELKPVECAGVTIQHATLHNFDEITRLNIKEGDRILIERAGDVIPKVVKVVEDRGGAPIKVPRSCPACSGKVIKEKEEDVAYRCINPLCPAQLERALAHFASRQAMDIEGMGESMVSQLVKLKLVKDFADIYKLKSQDLAKLELFKEKKISNLLSAIEKSKGQPLSRLIYALGIRHVGEKAAFVLAAEFKNMDNLCAAKYVDLDKIYEVGPVLAESIVEYFSQDSIKKLLHDFKKLGLNLKEEVALRKGSSFSGKTIVFTGELKKFSRLQAQRLVRQLGGNAVSSVSAHTDLVVTGENPGSKYKKARELGVKIISEKEFSRLISF